MKTKYCSICPAFVEPLDIRSQLVSGDCEIEKFYDQTFFFFCTSAVSMVPIWNYLHKTFSFSIFFNSWNGKHLFCILYVNGCVYWQRFANKCLCDVFSTSILVNWSLFLCPQSQIAFWSNLRKGSGRTKKKKEKKNNNNFPENKVLSKFD